MLENIALAATFAAVVCWGFGDFFIQKATRRIGSVESLFFIGLIGSIILLPFVWNELPALLYFETSLFLFFIGAFTFVVAIILFEALKEGKLSIIDVLFEIELPATIILGLFFFREIISLGQALLILAIFSGIVLMAIEKFSAKHLLPKLEKGVLLAIIGSIGMGMLNFFTASASRNISPLLAIWMPFASFALLCLIVIAMRGGLGNLARHAAKNRGVILAEGLFDTLAWTFFAFALAASALSITTAITESYPALAIFLGIIINKEKIAKHQLLGAFISLAGSIVLALFI